MVWIVKKGISCLLILLGVTFVTFALMYLAGGDAISYRSRSGFVTHSSLCIRKYASSREPWRRSCAIRRNSIPAVCSKPLA